MPGKEFSIKLSSKLVAPARHMHRESLIGDDRQANRSFDAFLSEVVTVAIVERIRAKSEKGPNKDRQLCA